MPQNIHYFSSIIGDKKKLEPFRPYFAAILSGQLTAGMDFKQLKPHNIFTVRINLIDRIIFGRVDNDLVFLEGSINHKHVGSKFLNPAVLQRFMHYHVDFNNPAHRFTREDFSGFKEEDFSPIAPDTFKQQDSQFDFCAAGSFSGKLLTWSPEQIGLMSSPLPILARGLPGTGKTMAALDMVAGFLGENPDSRGVYIAKASLINEARQLFASRHDFDEAMSARMLFFSTEDLLYYAEEQSVFDDFKAWYRNSPLVYPPHELYQEMILIAAYGESAYLKLGERETVLGLKPNARTCVFDEFKAFNAFLKRRGRADFALANAKLNLLCQFDFMVIDEAQLLSLQQIKDLRSFLHPEAANNMIFLLDNNQAKDPKISKAHHIAKILNVRLHEHSLVTALRCPKPHYDLVNAVLGIKYHYVGTVDKYEEVAVDTSKVRNDNDNAVIWLDGLRPSDISRIQANSQSSELLIIAAAKYHQSLRALFPQASCLTAEDAVGLTRKQVILFKPFTQNKTAIALNKDASFIKEGGQGKTVHRNKEGRTLPKNVELSELHEWIIPMSRSIEDLIIVNELAGVDKLIGWLRSQSAHVCNPDTLPLLSKSTQEDWLKNYHELMRKNKPQEAARILQQHIRPLGMDWLMLAFNKKNLQGFLRSLLCAELFAADLQGQMHFKRFIQDATKRAVLVELLNEDPELVPKLAYLALQVHALEFFSFLYQEHIPVSLDFAQKEESSSSSGLFALKMSLQEFNEQTERLSQFIAEHQRVYVYVEGLLYYFTQTPDGLLANPISILSEQHDKILSLLQPWDGGGALRPLADEPGFTQCLTPAALRQQFWHQHPHQGRNKELQRLPLLVKLSSPSLVARDKDSFLLEALNKGETEAIIFLVKAGAQVQNYFELRSWAFDGKEEGRIAALSWLLERGLLRNTGLLGAYLQWNMGYKGSDAAMKRMLQQANEEELNQLYPLRNFPAPSIMGFTRQGGLICKLIANEQYALLKEILRYRPLLCPSAISVDPLWMLSTKTQTKETQELAQLLVNYYHEQPNPRDYFNESKCQKAEAWFKLELALPLEDEEEQSSLSMRT